MPPFRHRWFHQSQSQPCRSRQLRALIGISALLEKASRQRTLQQWWEPEIPTSSATRHTHVRHGSYQIASAASRQSRQRGPPTMVKFFLTKLQKISRSPVAFRQLWLQELLRPSEKANSGVYIHTLRNADSPLELSWKRYSLCCVHFSSVLQSAWRGEAVERPTRSWLPTWRVRSPCAFKTHARPLSCMICGQTNGGKISPRCFQGMVWFPAPEWNLRCHLLIAPTMWGIRRMRTHRSS